MTGYASPADLELSELVRLDGNDWQTEPATLAEVEQTGLVELIAVDTAADGRQVED